MLHNIVYKITNLINGKKYIGVHSTDNIDDGYMGSGLLIRRAIKKYGVENFKKEILVDYDTPEVAYRLEKMLVNEDFVKREDTYNQNVGGKGGSVKGSRTAWNKGMTFSEEWIEKHYSHKPLSDEAKAKISKAKKGKPGPKITEEGRKRLSERMLENKIFSGRQHSDETKVKMSISSKNNWAKMTPERKQEIIQKCIETKKRMTPERKQEIIQKRAETIKNTPPEIKQEWRRKISEGKKGKPGHKHSEESKRKMSEARKAYYARKKGLE